MQLYIKENGNYYKIEHPDDTSERLKVTRSTLRSRRLQKKQKESDILVRGGRYIILKEVDNN